MSLALLRMLTVYLCVLLVTPYKVASLLPALDPVCAHSAAVGTYPRVSCYNPD